MYGGSDASNELRAQQQAREQQVRGLQKGIEQQYSGYDPTFYGQREKAYMNYAMPLLNEQHGQAQNNLAYEMARRGLLKSSAGAELQGSLATEFGRQRMGAVDASRSQANDLRKSVEQSRSSMMSQAQSTLDPSLAWSQAVQAAQQFQTPSTFAPIGQAFQDWTKIALAKQPNQYYNQVAQTPLTFGNSNKSSFEVGK
jgi:hypothetical protein